MDTGNTQDQERRDMSNDNTQDGAEPSLASAGSHNTLAAANSWLQEEIKRLRLTHSERQAIFRAMYLATGVDSAVLSSLLERTR